MLFQCKACGPATDHGSASRRSGKAKRWRTIDIHCHCMVPEANALVLKATGIPGGGETPNANAHVNALTKSIQPQRGKIDFPKLTDLDTRLADMDRDGIDVQVISPYPGHFVYAAPPEVARDSCYMVNDHIAGMVAKYPDRLMGMGTVPLQDPGMAVTELNRTVRELGFRGVELCTNVRGVDLTRAGLEKFFARAEELGVMIFLHPFGTSLVGRMEDHYFPNTVGHPLDSALCVGHLVFDGYLERFPELKICIAHGGGYIPGYWGRFDHAFAHREDCRVNIKKAPSEYLKKLYFDTVVFDERELKHLIEIWGADHVMLGTDYPFDLSVRHGGARSGRLSRPGQGRQQGGHGAGGGRQCRAAVRPAGRRMIDALDSCFDAFSSREPVPLRSKTLWQPFQRRCDSYPHWQHGRQ
jgi:aminocarboxymuconate-semialdehyde decarboxylase